MGAIPIDSCLERLIKQASTPPPPRKSMLDGALGARVLGEHGADLLTYDPPGSQNGILLAEQRFRRRISQVPKLVGSGARAVDPRAGGGRRLHLRHSIGRAFRNLEMKSTGAAEILESVGLYSDWRGPQWQHAAA